MSSRPVSRRADRYSAHRHEAKRWLSIKVTSRLHQKLSEDYPPDTPLFGVVIRTPSRQFEAVIDAWRVSFHYWDKNRVWVWPNLKADLADELRAEFEHVVIGRS